MRIKKFTHKFCLFVLIILTLILAICLLNCNKKSPTQINSDDNCAVPLQTDDGWGVASLNSVGMDAAKFTQLIDRLKKVGEHRIHSILVVRNNKLVFEIYYPGPKFNLGQYTGATGYGLNDLHVLCSATKSVTSALLGIAIGVLIIYSISIFKTSY